jgi:hypothetical protein
VRRAFEYYQRGGLVPAPWGEEYKAEIRRASDPLGELLERRFVLDPNEYALRSRVNEVLDAEYREQGLKLPDKGFKARLQRKGFKQVQRRVNGRREWVYLGLTPRGEA